MLSMLAAQFPFIPGHGTPIPIPAPIPDLPGIGGQPGPHPDPRFQVAGIGGPPPPPPPICLGSGIIPIPGSHRGFRALRLGRWLASGGAPRLVGNLAGRDGTVEYNRHIAMVDADRPRQLEDQDRSSDARARRRMGTPCQCRIRAAYPSSGAGSALPHPRQDWS
jgi:hypothetical protein